MTNSIREIRDADCIFITGSNTAESHPVISYEVIRAAKRGANIVIVDPRKIPLTDHATLFLQVKPGTDIYVFLAIIHLMIQKGWLNEDFVNSRTEGFDDLKNSVATYTPERAALMSGVPVEKIEAAAKIYALGIRSTDDSIFNEDRGRSTILYAMGITQRSNGTDMVMTLANMAMLSGQIGKPSTGVNPLRGQANVQGACDLGCLVNVFPGYLPVTDAKARATFENAWQTENLSGNIGLTIVEAMHMANEGKVRSVYVMGENPMMSDPNTNHVEKALRSLDFLVVQDIFPSETAHLAHIILPAAASLEKDGTFTNTERRVQLLNPVVQAPGKALPDWKIVGEIAQRFDDRMGFRRPQTYWKYNSTSEIFDEIASVTPIYHGINHKRLRGEGLQWPCPNIDHPGTSYLHKDKFSRGLGKFTTITALDPAEQPDDEFPLILSTGRVLFHYHTGTMTRRSSPLSWVEPSGYIEVNFEDANKAGIEDGHAVSVKSRRGNISTQLKISEDVPQGTVFLAFHWRESPANILTQDFKLDPVAKIPEYKVCAIRLEKI